MRTFALVLLACSLLAAQRTDARSAPPKGPGDKADRIAREIAKRVEKIRGLRFKHPVKIGMYSVVQLKAMILKLMDEEMSGDQMIAYQRGLKAMGLLPRGYDLRAGVTELLQSQIAGFYDPEARELRLIDRALLAEGEQVGGGMSSMMGGAGMTQEDLDQVVMAHELTHALQDQHFDLRSLPMDVTDDDDLVTAIKSVVEGDATVLMMAWVMEKQMGKRASDLFAMAGMVRMSMRLLGGKALKAAPEFQHVPAFLIQSLVFPYMEGLSFCLSAGGRRGFAGVDRTFKSPPLSTEQVLHPKKALGSKRDDPQVLRLPDLAGALGPGARKLAANTLGELYTRVMLADEQATLRKARRAAAGWGGDRYVLYERPGDCESLIWYTTWDSEGDADEFAAALEIYRDARRKKEEAADRSDPRQPSFTRGEATMEMTIQLKRDVILLAGIPKRALGQVLAQVLQETTRKVRTRMPARKREK